MNERRWTILGDPVATGRPRFVRSTGIAFTPARSRDWKAKAIEVFACGWDGAPFEGPVELEVTAVFARPKRLMRVKDPSERIPFMSRPDWDNTGKAASDALEQAGVIRNDSQVWDGRSRKFYAAKAEGPRVEVVMRWATRGEQ